MAMNRVDKHITTKNKKQDLLKCRSKSRLAIEAVANSGSQLHSFMYAQK
jgi:hypothetical protein